MCVLWEGVVGPGGRSHTADCGVTYQWFANESTRPVWDLMDFSMDLTSTGDPCDPDGREAQ